MKLCLVSNAHAANLRLLLNVISDTTELFEAESLFTNFFSNFPVSTHLNISLCIQE